jgi:hypothetical protein
MHSYAVTSPDLLKRTALLFDKVYCSQRMREKLGVPEEVIVDRPELELEVRHGLQVIKNHFPFDVTLLDEDVETLLERTARCEITLVADVYNRADVPLVPVYESRRVFDRQFPQGDVTAYQVILSELDIPDDSSLEWEQVVDFRQNTRALTKYRSLQKWVRESLASASVEDARDILAQHLDEYSRLLRDSGFKTVKGVLIEVASGAAVFGVALSHGDPVTAVITAGLAIGKVALTVVESRRDLKNTIRSHNAAVAVIYEAKKQFGNGARRA